VTVGKTVLLIAGNEVERLGLTAVLQREGYTVVAAETGTRAHALVRAGCRPDVVLLDVSGGGRGGWGFLDRRLREPWLSSVPVVLVTEPEGAGPDRARSLSACACLRKPYDVPALLDAVRRCAE
jgi:CheY-like chemotaxis protein